MDKTATVWVFAENWQPLGTDQARGVWLDYEDLEVHADEHGPAVCTFTVRRDGRLPWPDLQAGTRAVVEIGGREIYSGRVRETPHRLGDQAISVQLEGSQSFLDDELLSRVYVHSRLADWQDMRSVPTALLGATHLSAAGVVSNDRGAITLLFPKDYAIDNPAACAVVLNTRKTGGAKRVVIDWSAWGTDSAYKLIVRGSDYPDNDQGWTTGNYEDIVTAGAVAGPTTSRGTFTTARRYVHLIFASTYAQSLSGDIWVRINGVQVFGDAAYESGDASALTVDKVAADVLPSQLSQDLSRVEAGSALIPDLAPLARRTPRQLLDAAIAIEQGFGYRVDAADRLHLAARPTVPRIALGSWGAYDMEDASSGSLGEIYDDIIVTGTAPDGTPVERTVANAGTVTDRQGITRSHEVAVGMAVTTASADLLGAAFAADHRTVPFAGRATVVGQAAQDYATGTPVPPEALLGMVGELICFTDRIDPDTGGWGRDGRIVAVSYRPATDTAVLDIDNRRADFDTLIAGTEALAA